MKSLVVILGALSLTAILFTKCDEGPQSSQSEIQSQGSPSSSREANSNSQVTGFTAKASGPNEINLAWDSVPNAAAYWIYRDSLVPAIIMSTNYIDRAVRPDSTYTYAISAVVNGVLSPKSRAVTVTTPQ